MGRKVGKVGETLETELKQAKTKEEKQKVLTEAVEDVLAIAEEQQIVDSEKVEAMRASWR